MSEDRLLQAFGRLAREEEQQHDERWDAFSAGALSPEEEAELAARAEESAEAAAAYEAFRPLGADFRARLVDRLGEQLRSPPPVESLAEGAGSRPRRRILPFARPRRGLQMWWLIPAAAAAAALILVLRPAPDLPPLPPYDLTLGGEVRQLRSPAAPGGEAVRIYAAGNRFRLLLTPSTTARGPVAVRVFWTRPGELAVLEAPPAEVSAAGAVQLEGEVGREIRLPAGESSLLIVVGRPESLPDGEELRARLGAVTEVRAAAWSAWKVALRLE